MEKLIFTKVDTLTDTSQKESLISIDAHLQGNRILDLLYQYMEEHEFDCDFYFNTGTVFLGKGKPKIQIIEKYFSKESNKKIEETY